MNTEAMIDAITIATPHSASSSLNCIAIEDFSMPRLDTSMIENLKEILVAHFSNGYRLNSPIELTRFRTFAEECLTRDILMTDDELRRYIAACGTIFDGKVYIVSEDTKAHILTLAEDYFAKGSHVIFFDAFYNKNENWLFEENVISKDMLIDILHSLFPNLSFTQTYFGDINVSVAVALKSEILRVWGDHVLLTYDQLAERLPYIPIDRIKSALSQNGDFIRNNAGTFSHISRIEITDAECEAIRAFAIQKCDAIGYISVTNLPLEEIEERNYELSITAVHNAVYRICLADKFDKRGKIITRKGTVSNILTIMEKYCRTINRCSLNDLLNFGKELTGEAHRRISMEAGNKVLVRTDKETYVAEKYVFFDADKIDEAIEFVVKGDYLPLKAFTTFGAFPDCGQTWNLFLLESYCRRFSRKFRFDTLSVNSRNIGVVIRKSCRMDYTEIMIDAVAKAGVPLQEAIVERFLIDRGYTGRSKNAKTPEIMNKVKSISKKGE